MFELRTIAWVWSPAAPPMAIALGVLVAFVVLASSLRRRFSRGFTAAFAVGAIRLVLLGMLAVFLLNPSEATPRDASPNPTQIQKPTLVLLIDTSRSMQTADVSNRSRNRVSRLDAVKKTWLTAAHLQRLQERFDVRLMRVDSAVREVDLSQGLEQAIATLPAEGNESALRTGVAQAVSEAAASAAGGRVVVWSDGREIGNQSTPEDSTDRTRVVVDAVAMASAASRETGVPRLEARAEPTALHIGESGTLLIDVFGRENASLTVGVRGTGAAMNWRRSVRLGRDGHGVVRIAIGADGIDQRAMLAEWSVAGALTADEQARIARITKPTDEAGVRSGDWYEVGAEIADRPVSVGVFVARVREPARVLLVDGAPNWDTRELSRAFASMADVEFTRAVAVSLREGAEDEAELRAAVPSTVGGWGRFDVVILGGAVHELIDDSQGAALAQSVRELGGHVMFTRGNQTTNSRPAWIGELDPSVWSGEFSGGGKLVWPGPTSEMTREVLGRWERGTPAAGATAWGKLQSDRGEWPALFEAGVGRGRVASLAGDGMWRWWMDAGEGASVYRQFWRRVLFGRLLGREDAISERLRLMAENPEGGATLAGQRVILRASTRRVLSSPTAALAATLEGPLDRAESASVTLPLVPQTGVVGQVWAAAWTPVLPGIYRVSVPPVVPGDAAASRIFQVMERDRELDDVSLDLASLRAMSEPTGGIVMSADGAAGWSQRLLAREENRSGDAGTGDRAAGASEMNPIWNRGWIMSLLLGGLLLEWTVRRWLGWR